MGWIVHRNIVIAIAALTALVLLGMFDSAGFGLSSSIMGTGIKISTLLMAGQAYIAWALWSKYV
jgi:hypothetical protein